MKKLLSIALLACFGQASFAATYFTEKNAALSSFIENNYNELKFDGVKPQLDVYRKGIIGYLNLKKQNQEVKSDLLTLIDFRLSSNKKRMWIINLKENKVVHHSLVAHGRTTGNEFATTFSNTPNSNSSSIGFYLTGETYYGKHGLSLRLDGLEEGYNHNARKRAVVIHGAEYVDRSFAETYGRIGRSFGCPAIPLEGHEEVIKRIADKTLLFIYYPDEAYFQNSRYIDRNSAVDVFTQEDFSFFN